MKHEDKINHLKIAANISRFGLDLEQCDLLVSLYELILKKGGDADIRDISKVEADVKQRTNARSLQDALDKVSKKRT